MTRRKRNVAHEIIADLGELAVTLEADALFRENENASAIRAVARRARCARQERLPSPSAKRRAR